MGKKPREVVAAASKKDAKPAAKAHQPDQASGGGSSSVGLYVVVGLLVAVVAYQASYINQLTSHSTKLEEKVANLQSAVARLRSVDRAPRDASDFCFDATETCVEVTIYPNGGNNTVFPGDPDNGVKVSLTASTNMKALTTTAIEMIVDVYSRASVDVGKRLVVHTSQGIPIHNFNGVKSGDLLYLVPADSHWVWPGVYVGHVEVLDDIKGPNGEQLRVKTMSMKPRVFSIEEFLSDPECEEVIVDAKATGMFKSKLFTPGAETAGQARTSEQAWLPYSSKISERLSDRVELLTKISQGNGEQIQVIHYQPHAHYHSHYDFFEPVQYPGETYEYMSLDHGRNRIITVLFYLNDVEEGGETNFPNGPNPDGNSVHLGNPEVDYASCEQGLSVPPTKRSAVLFYSMEPDLLMEGHLDYSALHAGCDVIKGEKWASNKWIYNMRPEDAKARNPAGIWKTWQDTSQAIRQRLSDEYERLLRAGY